LISRFQKKGVLGLKDSPVRRISPNKINTDTYIFTDESIQDEMKGTDKLWYAGLDKRNHQRRELEMGEQTPAFHNNNIQHKESQNSTEQYNKILSLSSDNSAANAVRLFKLATQLHEAPDKF
jgi:hypothetical protein